MGNTFTTIRKLAVMGVIFTFTLCNALPVHASAILFQDDNFATVDSDNLVIDNNNTNSGNIILQFGQTLAKTLLYSQANSRFEFNAGVDLGNNQLSTARVENVASMPGGAGGLTSGDKGRIVQLTATDSTAPGCTVSPNCTAGTYSWSGTAWQPLVNSTSTSTPFAQTVTVALSGGDFTSIKAAADSITDSSTTKRYQILVYPGTYSEAPITLPQYTSIQGLGNWENIIVNATTTTSPLLTAGHDSIVNNIRLTGASGAGGICLNVPDSSYANGLEIRNCETGILVSGASASLISSNIVTDTGVFTDFIKVASGAYMWVSGLNVASNSAITRAVNVDGSGTRLVVDGSISGTSTTYGLYIDNGGHLDVKSIIVINAGTGLYAGTTGANLIHGNTGNIISNSTYDLDINGTSKIYFSGLLTEKEKVHIASTATNVLSFNDPSPTENSFNVLGELSVGEPEHAQETHLGEGNEYTEGELVYTYNGSTYTDVSSAAKTLGTTFTFPGVSANNAIYISSDHLIASGDYAKFQGMRYTTTATAAVLGGGSIVHEYWNGSAWTQFNNMCLHATLLYRYNESCFIRASNDENDIFSSAINPGWTKNDPPSTGTNRYWMRLRIATGITTAPVFDQFYLHPNSTQFNPDGTMTLFGNARHRRTFVVSPDMMFFGTGTNAPRATSFTVGTGGGTWTDERQRASFSGSTLQELSGSISVPKGVDTSSGLHAKIYWKKSDSNSGNVVWKINYLVNGPQNIQAVDGSNISTAPRATAESITATAGSTITTAATGVSSSTRVIASDFTTDIDLTNHFEGDTIFVRLYRDPSDSGDTYGSSAIVTGFEMSGVFWTLGEKLNP